ncbi:MAG: hypothetical protein GC159_05135 [Phycisphaera sp.]|nr:hypothetical protein [Phycisphaera sp.]
MKHPHVGCQTSDRTAQAEPAADVSRETSKRFARLRHDVSRETSGNRNIGCPIMNAVFIFSSI